jgi:MFS family permease
VSLTPGVDSTPRAWRVVLACFVSAVFAWGFGFYAHGIYLVELQRAHGWSTGLISSVVTGHYVLGALLLPRIAQAIGRFGPQRVLLGGLAITGLPLLLLPGTRPAWCRSPPRSANGSTDDAGWRSTWR